MPDPDSVEERRHGDDLRGSTPVLSARDVLIELRDDVREMKRTVDILASQNLDSRVTQLERQQSRQLGLTAGVAAAAGVLTSLIGIFITSGLLHFAN